MPSTVEKWIDLTEETGTDNICNTNELMKFWKRLLHLFYTKISSCEPLRSTIN